MANGKDSRNFKRSSLKDIYAMEDMTLAYHGFGASATLNFLGPISLLLYRIILKPVKEFFNCVAQNNYFARGLEVG